MTLATGGDMTDHITIPRALLEQALEALEIVTDDYDDSAVGLEIDAIQALRAELAKPEQEESFIPDWANYRQGVADGKAGSPKWHDAPTEPGWWVRNSYEGIGVYSISEPSIKFLKGSAARWYGPIPQDGEKS